jgi:hypothetical protein
VLRPIGAVDPWWIVVVVAVALELTSCISFVIVFRLFFDRVRARDARALAWTEMASGALLPGGGIVHCAAASCQASTPETTARPRTAEGAVRRADRAGLGCDRGGHPRRGRARCQLGGGRLAWVRTCPTVTSRLIGARTIEQLQSNLASLEITLAPEQLAALNKPSTPSLDFPAAITAGISRIFGFGGATVDGVELPAWEQLLTSSARY